MAASTSGMVGAHRVPNGNAPVYGVFEHSLNEYKSVQVTASCTASARPARGEASAEI